MTIKLTILLFNPIGPFHWSCQHIAAIAKDLSTGKTMNLEFQNNSFVFYEKSYIDETEKNYYRECYVYDKSKSELHYVNHDSEFKQIPIQHQTQFDRERKQLNPDAEYCMFYTKTEITNLVTKNTDHEPPAPFTIFPDEKSNPLSRFIGDHCCIGKTVLYSNQNFDSFAKKIAHKFSDLESYDYLSNNCASAINVAIDELCPDKAKTDLCFNIYKTLCCPFFFGTLGLSCFPAPPLCCDTPQDVYHKAKWLSTFTNYGKITFSDKSLINYSFLENGEKKENLGELSFKKLSV